MFWEGTAVDPFGNVIDETLGNGIRAIRGFDLVTGLLDYIQSGPGGGATRQDLTFVWDAVGNLTQRNDLRLSLTEGFTYDNLHRLTSTTGADPKTLTYNAMGNIGSKTGVGTYTYHATKKHAVTAAGSNTYGYDANGNMNSRNGLSTTWYSYNLPNTINGPSSNSSQFFYAPDRSRWKQVASYAGTPEQTIYIGGLVEKVTLGGVTSWKHYIAGGTGAVATYIRRSSGTNEIVYLLKDHLGSVDVVTNSSGNQLSRLSFDAWGRRRNGGTWSGNPAASAWTTITNTTRRGFTFHEMADNLNLTHMNGRVYDQIIGRFMSADPIVQAPGFTQSFNRYSYTFNNPLSYTDPSGFEANGPIISRIDGQRWIEFFFRADYASTLRDGVRPGATEWPTGEEGRSQPYVPGDIPFNAIPHADSMSTGSRFSAMTCVRAGLCNPMPASREFEWGVADVLIGTPGFFFDISGRDIRYAFGIDPVDTQSTGYQDGFVFGVVATFGLGRLAAPAEVSAAGSASVVSRVRHHTSAEAVASIRRQGVINPSRGGGVHVETQPYGPVRTASQETGAFGRGAYVEFNTPTGIVPTNVGPRNTAVIPTNSSLSLQGTNPWFVTRPWWKFWGD